MTTYRLRGGARNFYTGVGVLFGGLGLLMLGSLLQRSRIGPDEILLAVIGGVFLALGLWSLYGAYSGRIDLESRQVVINGAFGTSRIRYDDVAELAFFRNVIHGARFTAHMMRKQHDGGVAVHLWIKTGPKKAKHVTTSMYESSRELMQELQARAGTRLVELERGALGRWMKRDLD